MNVHELQEKCLLYVKNNNLLDDEGMNILVDHNLKAALRLAAQTNLTLAGFLSRIAAIHQDMSDDAKS